MPPLEKKPAVLAPWPPVFGKTYILATGKNFKSITSELGWTDPLALLWYNFRTVEPAEVNYYLHNYVGCTLTTPDGKNFRFHDADYPGVIYVPMDGRQPAVCWEKPYHTKEKPTPKKLPQNPYEPPPKNAHAPRPMNAYELAQLKIVEGHPPNLTGNAPFDIKVGDLKLAMTDIRKVISVSMQEVVYMVIETDSKIGDSLHKGRVYRQTAYGFISDLNYAYLAETGRNAKGGQVMMKKEAELLVGAACSAVGAFGGVAAITAATMNLLLMNSEQIFTAARGIEQLMKVKDVLSQYTPEFWTLCKTILKLSMLNTPEAMWSDPYGSIRLAGELVIIVGEAVLLKRVKALGLVADIIKKLMQGFFGKLTDAGTKALALAGNDIVKVMKEFDPSVDEERATKIANELKENWKVVEPALTVLKSVADQLVGA